MQVCRNHILRQNVAVLVIEEVTVVTAAVAEAVVVVVAATTAAKVVLPGLTPALKARVPEVAQIKRYAHPVSLLQLTPKASKDSHHSSCQLTDG